MRWWPRRSRLEMASRSDVHYAQDVEHMKRALTDAQHLGRAADDLNRRADHLNDQWRQARELNGIAEAAIRSIMRSVQHP